MREATRALYTVIIYFPTKAEVADSCDLEVILLLKWNLCAWTVSVV